MIQIVHTPQLQLQHLMTSYPVAMESMHERRRRSEPMLRPSLHVPSTSLFLSGAFDLLDLKGKLHHRNVMNPFLNGTHTIM